MSGSRVLVVVGAGPGIGAAVGARFAKEGFKVALLSRKLESLLSIEQEVKAAGAPETLSVACDASSKDSVISALATVNEKLGAPNVLVYNAAILTTAKLVDTDYSEVEAANRVNLGGALNSAQAVLPFLRSQKSGSILVTGGGLALGNFSPYGVLGIGKAAVRSAVQALHQELKPENIHVATVTVCGFVKPGTPYDPKLIAEDFWELHNQHDPNSWSWEKVYKK
eukprot:TRINITY_DN2119_c0_g1_i1.p1 TRINITY_DN2119_c0_g1~~TRINITY_DN2119_c0_g1_i1.p1  ORF type:complete len:237 (-),score=63.42 TRINITY_DN2119_c0_g1_i1:56-727(-)